ncbi:MAG: energy-coupling factor transporter transmembrane component T [Clostridia bacterium]
MKKEIYPLVAIAAGLFILLFGLIMAKTVESSFFLLAVFVWFWIFGWKRACLHILPVFFVVGTVFFLIFYFATGKALSALYIVNRLAAILLGIVPGMGTRPVRMTRNLSQLRVPRSITLGMLIAMSFPPLLAGEIRRVQEAMKTRGAGSFLSPQIFYRAFLIPFVTRLVAISDTLALSVETRGFSLSKTPYTVYEKESIALIDIIFLFGLMAGAILMVVL